MKKLFGILLLGFCCANLTACFPDEPFGTPEEEVSEDNLSCLYIKTRKEASAYYGFGPGTQTETTAEIVTTYEGNRVVGEDYKVTTLQYDEDGSVWHSSDIHEVISCSWNGLTCTRTYEAIYDGLEYPTVVVEYLDDTYLRIKTQESEFDNHKLVFEYDGKKITKESLYLDGVLQYDKVYEYKGLTATYVMTYYVPTENPDYVGVQMTLVGGKITYQDNTFLRVVRQEYDYRNSNGDATKEIITNTYDGVKRTKCEQRIEGTINGYTYGDDAVYMLAEYEWDGLKCRGTIKQFHQDPQPPYNEYNGKVAAITDTEFEYLDFEPAK